MPKIEVDLYSDTQTRPSAEMRSFMGAAEVGDEQRGEDPTVNLLQEMVAGLLGMEAALYLPSGTMCNEIAIKVHTRPGDEVLLDRTAHPLTSEAGAPGMLSGVILTPLVGTHGVFTGAQVEAAIRPHTRYAPPTRLVSIENTSNSGGGTVWPPATVREVRDVAHRRGLMVHMDGARLMNAVVASGIKAADFAQGLDSAWIDFTKGLGAPVGAVLAGSAELIGEAWRRKQMLGGALRQSGIVAAGCLYALDHHVERLSEDHEHARLLAEGLAELPSVGIDPAAVQTNIVIFDVPDAPALVRGVAEDVELQAVDAHRVRAVTHLDIGRADIETTLAALRRALR
jgi:threonine aldolase